MKICAYVQQKYAKTAYKNECMDNRQFIGLRVVVDCLERAGYEVEYAGAATVHQYDIVLVSLTSDCDWWPYIAERLRWESGNYKVLVGGPGVLHVTPFTRWFYAAMLGRGEDLIVPLVQSIELGERYANESICYADEHSEDKIYRVAQARTLYPHCVKLTEKRDYTEGEIGCNHKCLFCGYTWQRQHLSPYKDYRMGSGLFGGMADKERAMLDMRDHMDAIDWAHLRTTAIDGFSERLRVGVAKPITHEILHRFLTTMLQYPGAPHQIKLFNICGYPSETEDDWMEFMEELRIADDETGKREKQWSIVLHTTPFRPMPATPMACAPMSKRNYRGMVGKTLGKDLRGGLIYQGKSLWAVESMGTDGLATVMLSAIAHRGSADDSENIEKLCANKKFWGASAAIREATLTRYFNMDKLFGAYTPETLPSRYLRTYAQIEKLWGNTPLEIASRGGVGDSGKAAKRD